MAVYESDESLADIINQGTISDDDDAASDVPPWYLFLLQRIFHRGTNQIFSEDSQKNSAPSSPFQKSK